MHNNKGDEDKKLDWMYKKPGKSINHEDYLLGKTIDKEFEALAQEERIKNQEEQGLAPKNHVEHECVPFSIRSYKNAPQEQVDMARKLQEDPLVAIKRKEMETRQQLLQNPVKLKELHRILKEEKMKKMKKKKKKKDSNEKKSKKSKSKDKSKKLVEKDLDDILAEKYAKLKSTLDETLDMGNLLKNKNKSSSDSSECDSSEDEPSTKKSKYTSNQNSFQLDKSRNLSRDKNKLSSNELNENFNKNRYSRKHNDYDRKDSSNNRRHVEYDRKNRSEKFRDANCSEIKQEYRSRYKDSSGKRQYSIGRENNKSHKETDSKKDGNKYKSDSSDNEGNKAYIKTDKTTSYYGLVTADGKKIELKRSNNEPSQKVSDRNSKSASKKQFINHKRPKLSEEEIEARRKEMQENALWRDRELEKNIKRYKEEDKKEQDKNSSSFDTEFLKKQLAKAAERGTLESRIKSNINNIQRSGKSMDMNFARR